MNETAAAVDESNPNTRVFLEALAENPFDKMNRDVFADHLEECGDVKRAMLLRNGFVVMTPFDLDAAKTLRKCNFAPATADKRFARELGEWVLGNDNCPPNLSPRRYLWMWCLLRRYRRSVPTGSIKAEAEKRYEGYLKLLDLHRKKPQARQVTKKTDMRPSMFDDQ